MNLGLVSPYDQLIIFHSCELSFLMFYFLAPHLDKKYKKNTRPVLFDQQY